MANFRLPRYQWRGREHSLNGLSRVIANTFPHSLLSFGPDTMCLRWHYRPNMPIANGALVRELRFPVTREPELNVIGDVANEVIYA
jgi:hypothetical protein